MITASFLLLFACSPKTRALPLPDEAAERLRRAGQHPERLGELVYRGRVQARGQPAEARFAYERRVKHLGTEWTSSHLTRRIDGTPLLLQVATYTEEHGLQSFEEIHGQTGLVGHATVKPQGELASTVTLGTRTETFAEPAGDPVHVGPSLFGFVLEHWGALTAAETRTLRFLALDAGRTYRFTVRLESSDPNTTTFRMTATSVLLRLVVPAFRIVFDTSSREPLRYDGWVPPMTGPPRALRKFDARVDYTLVSER